MRRRDSAAMVPKTSELLPDPETPVNTVSRRFGISTLTSFRLFTRAPVTRIRSWLSAACMRRVAPSVVRQGGEGLLGVLVPAHALDRVLPAATHVVVRGHVGLVAGGDHVLEVLVLLLDHVVGALPLERLTARTAHLLARHRLHLSAPPGCGPCCRRGRGRRSPACPTAGRSAPARPRRHWPAAGRRSRRGSAWTA